MRDLKEETLAEMLKAGVPAHNDLPEEQQATAEAVRAIALGDIAPNPAKQRTPWQCTEEHALCYRRWGLAYVKDSAAYLLFCAAKLKCGDDHTAGVETGMILPAVNWDIMDKLFRENWEAYRDERKRRGTDKGIGASVAQLKWALGSKGIPDVREPGDLHRRMTLFRGPAN